MNRKELKKFIRETIREELNTRSARKPVKESLAVYEKDDLATAATYGEHEDYFTKLCFILLDRLAKRFGVTDYSKDAEFWKDLPFDILMDIDSISSQALGCRRDYEENFYDVMGRDMEKGERLMLVNLLKHIPKFFLIEGYLSDCSVAAFASGSDYYKLVIVGWRDDQISEEECVDAFDAGWNNEPIDYFGPAKRRTNTSSSFEDCMRNAYNAGVESRQWFDFLDTI